MMMKMKMKRKEKISTCVYVHSILDHWVCVSISEGHFYRVCLLLRVRMWVLWDSMLFVFALSYLFESEMSDLFLRTSSHCPFHHYIHYWCDFTSCLIWVDHHLSSYIHCFAVIFVIAYDSSIRFTLLVLFLHWPIPNLTFPFHRSCISHYQFDLPHCLIIDIIFALGILRSMAHRIYYTCCISYMRAWVFYHWVFEPSFPSFLLSYYPSLRYVLCLTTTLRPWDQMLSLIASTWTSVWDLVDI